MRSLLCCSWILASTVAAFSKQCLSTSKTCFSLHVPNGSIATGSGDVHFQIVAPTSYSWIALGQGTNFTNANLFVIYVSSNGKNVTLSPRLSDANHVPWYNNRTEAILMAGSAVQSNVMTANIKCSNCQSWLGGKMDFSGNSTDWIWAARAGSPLNSDDKTTALSTHDDYNYGAFRFDARAKGGDEDHPFMSQSSKSSGQSDRLVMIHGYVACLVFALMLPAGGMLIRSLHIQRLVWLHVVCQILGIAGYIVSTAAGLWLIIHDHVIEVSSAHASIGLLLLALLLAQLAVGYVQHVQVKAQGCRTLLSHLHLWIGRFIIPAGIGNGVVGFRMASASATVQIGFGVLGAVMVCAYIIVIIRGEGRRRREIAAAKSRAAIEVDEVRFEPPRAPTRTEHEGRTTSWLSGSTVATKMGDSKVTLVEPRKSCASVAPGQQQYLSEWQMPAKPAETYNKGRSMSLPAQSLKTNDRCSSIYSLQPEQEGWGSALSKRASAVSVMTLFPIASVEDLSLDPLEKHVSKSKTRHEDSSRLAQGKPHQWKSVTWPEDVTGSVDKQRSQSVSWLMTDAGPFKDNRSKSVGALQYSAEEWRSRQGSWPQEVPEPSDEDYFSYRFGYGQR